MKKQKQIDKSIGLELKENKIDDSETGFINPEHLPIEEEKEQYNIPWFLIVVAGILVLLIAVCLIVFFVFGGPISQW